jgi:hypothetical protein
MAVMKPVTRPITSKTRRVRRDECDRGESDGNAATDDDWNGE